MEGRVFVCRWQKTDAGYRVWVRSRSKVAAEADTFREADEALQDAILKSFGDGESQREYDPPAPSGDFRDSGLLLRLAMVSGQGSARAANPEALYTRGYCPQCKRPRGRRTAAPLVVDRIDSGFEAGSTYAGLAPADLNAPRVRQRYFSAEFLRILRPRERGGFEWRPVERTRRGKEYLELVSARVGVPFAAFRPEYCGTTLLKCDTCGEKTSPFYAFLPPTPSRYVSELDLPSPLPSCFAVGRDLCFTRERWRMLVGRASAKGLASSDVGVVDRRLVQRRPKYHLLSTET
jgi:hypothetical protein